MTGHPLGWRQGEKFPPKKILNPPQPKDGLWAGVCVYCGGSLGRPYQQDLFHLACERNND